MNYAVDNANCNGQEALIVLEHKCAVLIADLIQAPYHHPWGSSIYAKVAATNIIGESLESDNGNGAIILNYPDAPTDLANVPLITSSSQVGLDWLEGASNGGTPVIDYQIAYGEDTGNYVSLLTGITELNYIVDGLMYHVQYTVLGLTAGTTYKFKVQSRNEYGLSQFSEEVLILVAQIPDAPTNIVTSVVDFDVKIEWTPPSDQGSPITAY